MPDRHFLFLQGVASPFFNQLAQALKPQSLVSRINFCGGDCYYWSHKENTWNFTEPINELEEFLDYKHQEHKFTDIILFGDTRPVHRSAVEMAHQKNLRIWVFEEGYLRPNWLTLEANGVNGYSLLAKNSAYYQQRSPQLPLKSIALDTDYSQYIRFWHDLKYNFFRYLCQYKFSNYQLHRPQSPFIEYFGWIKRLPIQKLLYEPQAQKIIQNLLENKSKFFLFPLQIHYDAQIRYHSPFKNIQEAINLVLKSFAEHAPEDAMLIFKNHPLDIGIINYAQQIKRLALGLKLTHRILYIDGGDLTTLLQHSQGIVTINSTVGITALLHKTPVFTLGKAIYDLSGLTFQGRLDNFWQNPEAPNQNLVNQFRQILIHKTQINGNFYTNKGIQMAVKNSLPRLLNG